MAGDSTVNVGRFHGDGVGIHSEGGGFHGDGGEFHSECRAVPQ